MWYLLPNEFLVHSIRNQHLPSICWAGKLVQIESNEIIEEMSVNLTTENEELRPKDIERVSIAARRPRPRRESS